MVGFKFRIEDNTLISVYLTAINSEFGHRYVIQYFHLKGLS